MTGPTYVALTDLPGRVGPAPGWGPWRPVDQPHDGTGDEAVV